MSASDDACGSERVGLDLSKTDAVPVGQMSRQQAGEVLDVSNLPIIR